MICSRYGFENERPRHAYIKGEDAERADSTELRHGSEYVDSVLWNPRIRPEIIEID